MLEEGTTQARKNNPIIMPGHIIHSNSCIQHLGVSQECRKARQTALGEVQDAQLEILTLGLGKSPTGTTSCCSALEEEVKEQVQLEVGFQGHGQGRGCPRRGWSGPEVWTAPTPPVGWGTGALQMCLPNSTSGILQIELS